MAKLGLALLWGIPFLLGFINITRTTDLCRGGIEGASTVCNTPYCSCNDPYGRIYCSCKPPNSSYPQVSEITIQSSGHCSINHEAQDLIIADCLNVTFPENGLSQLRSLRSVQVSNVREVNIQRHAFHWNATTNGLLVRFTNATIADLPSYAFSGRIGLVVFRGVYLGLVHAFAFSSITDTERLQFVNCNFANIEPQSFKKFATNDFLLEGNRFNVIPSRFLVEVHVNNFFRIDSNFIDTMRTLSFQVSHPTDMTFSKNRIESIESEAFQVVTRGRVTFQDNAFANIGDGAFRGITADKKHSNQIIQEFLFENNTLGAFTTASLSLDTKSFHVRYSRMLIDDTCSCDNLVRWRDIIYPSQKKTKTPVEAHLTEIWCHQESKKETDFEFIAGETFYQNYCTTFIYSIYFFVVIIVSTTFVLFIVIVVSIFVIRRRRRNWNTVPTSEVRGITPKNSKETKGLVVPDGRVYRETEFQVIIEKAEPLNDVRPVTYRVTRDRSKSTFTRE